MSQAYNQREHKKMKKTLSATGSMSRFSHFQFMDDNLDTVDGMVIVAGLRIPPITPTSRHQKPDATGVFLTLAVNKSKVLRPFTTTIVKPNTTKENGPGFSCSPQDDSDRTNRVVGRVTILQERNGVERTLVQRKLKLPNEQLKPIVVYLLDCYDGSRYRMTVKPANSVKSFRKMLWREFDISKDETIVFDGNILTEGYTLYDYKITNKCTLHLEAE